MTRISATYNRDGNNVPINDLGFIATKSETFTSTATGSASLFLVTGEVAVRVFAKCNTDLTGSGDLAIGITGNSQALVAQAPATAIDAGEIWLDAVPAKSETLPSFTIISDEDIIRTIAGSTVLTGAVEYFCIWTPISEDGDISVA